MCCLHCGAGRPVRYFSECHLSRAAWSASWCDVFGRGSSCTNFTVPLPASSYVASTSFTRCMSPLLVVRVQHTRLSGSSTTLRKACPCECRPAVRAGCTFVGCFGVWGQCKALSCMFVHCSDRFGNRNVIWDSYTKKIFPRALTNSRPALSPFWVDTWWVVFVMVQRMHGWLGIEIIGGIACH